MLKLCGRVNSINVMKVLWALEELKVPYERVDAGMNFGIVNTPEYKAMNPNSRVPTIQDGALTLFESNAIVRYLAAKHGAGTLWPTDPAARADSDRWMDWASTTLQPVVTPVFWGLIRTPAEKRDARAIEAGVAGAREIECGVLGNDDPAASVPGEIIVTHPGFSATSFKVGVLDITTPSAPVWSAVTMVRTLDRPLATVG